MLNTSVYEFPAIPSFVSEHQPFLLRMAEEFPDVPAMPETLLAMELQLQERSVDLSEISALILDDIGATLQILRLAGREYGDSADRPVRIEDCISAVGLRACLRAASSAAPVKGSGHRVLAEFRAHSREIAHLCRLLADEMPELATPQEAYMTGLLHEIGALPALLNWNRCDLPANRGLAALRMAEQWSLPPFVKDFFRHASLPESRMSRLISMAHQLAAGSFAMDSLSSAAV